jgi:hypothetical protein
MPDGEIGRSLRRLEDQRFLTGAGRHVDDIPVLGQLHGVVLRSPHGLRRPVISMIAAAPSRSRVPAGSARMSSPAVVTFSPISPGAMSNPAARNSSNSSAWIRCT